MERYGLTVEGSFALLRRYSNTYNVKVAQLAADVVATGTLPDLESSGPNGGDAREQSRD
jgi:hypothetical protein